MYSGMYIFNYTFKFKVYNYKIIKHIDINFQNYIVTHLNILLIFFKHGLKII